MDLSNIGDLQTRGYAVIRNFLSASDIERLQQDYELNRKKVQGHQNFKTVFSKSDHGLTAKIQQVLDAIHTSTDVQADTIRNQGVFFDTEMEAFTWHQDTEWYFLFQDCYDIVNFWMPIIKKDDLSTGLSLVPYDRLFELVPDITHQFFLRQGAKQFTVLEDDRTSMFNLNDDITHTFDINFDKICETPIVRLGDVVVKRSDVIHRTQDTLTHRVAYSTRCVNSQAVISKQVLLTGGNTKQRYVNQLNKTLAMYQLIIRTFERKQSDTIKLADVLDNTHP
jgi:hypothetical protein